MVSSLNPSIIIKNLSKSFDRELFHDLNLTIENQGLLTILGSSGCGKTTLLNIIFGLEKPTKGTIETKFKNKTKKNLCYYVATDSNILDNLTVKENLLFINKDLSLVQDIANQLQISSLLNQETDLLSKGEKQRLALAMAFLSNKPILLIDEPCANLDEENKEIIWKCIKDISQEKIVIVTTHNVNEAKLHADLIIDFNTLHSIPYIYKGKDVKTKENKSSLKHIFTFFFKSLKKQKVIYVFQIISLLFLFLFSFIYLNLSNIDIPTSYIQEVKSQPSDFVEISYNTLDKSNPYGYTVNDDIIRIYEDEYLDKKVYYSFVEEYQSLYKDLEIVDYDIALPKNTKTDVYFPCYRPSENIVSPNEEYNFEREIIPFNEKIILPYKTYHFICKGTYTFKNGFIAPKLVNDAPILIYKPDMLSSYDDSLDINAIQNSIVDYLKSIGIEGTYGDPRYLYGIGHEIYNYNQSKGIVEIVSGRNIESKNEVLIGNDELYQLLKEKNHLSFSFTLENGIQTYEIVGSYGTLYSHEDNFIISDSWYNELKNILIQNYYPSPSEQTFARPSYMIVDEDDIDLHKLELPSFAALIYKHGFFNYDYYQTNISKSTNMTMTLSIIFLVIFSLLFIYSMYSYFKKQERNIALLILMGKSFITRFSLFLAFIGIFFIAIPLILISIGGPFASELLVSLITYYEVKSLHLSVNYLVNYLIYILLAILLTMIISLFLMLFNKRHIKKKGLYHA